MDADPHPFSLCVPRPAISDKHPDTKYILCDYHMKSRSCFSVETIWGVCDVDRLSVPPFTGREN